MNVVLFVHVAVYKQQRLFITFAPICYVENARLGLSKTLKVATKTSIYQRRCLCPAFKRRKDMTFFITKRLRFINTCLTDSTDAFSSYCLNQQMLYRGACADCLVSGCKVQNITSHGVYVCSGIFLPLLNERKI